MSKGHMEALAVLKARRARVTTAVTVPLSKGGVFLPSPAYKPVAGSKCPMCGCKVPKRQSAADRQRASRKNRKAPA